MKNKFPERLKELREKKQISQREIVNQLNNRFDIKISQSGYCLWEKGKTEPTISSIINLCIYFDVSADYLIGLSDLI